MATFDRNDITGHVRGVYNRGERLIEEPEPTKELKTVNIIRKLNKLK